MLVYHDLLGLFDRFTPKFVKKYANLGQIIQEALQAFVNDVELRRFPAEEHTYTIDDSELESFLNSIESL